METKVGHRLMTEKESHAVGVQVMRHPGHVAMMASHDALQHQDNEAIAR